MSGEHLETLALVGLPRLRKLDLSRNHIGAGAYARGTGVGWEVGLHGRAGGRRGVAWSWEPRTCACAESPWSAAPQAAMLCAPPLHPPPTHTHTPTRRYLPLLPPASALSSSAQATWSLWSPCCAALGASWRWTCGETQGPRARGEHQQQQRQQQQEVLQQL